MRCGTFMCGGCVSAARDQRLCVRCYTRVVGGGRAQHLPLLSILSIIHGAVLVAASIFYTLVYAGVGSMMFVSPPAPPPGGGEQPPPELFGGIMFGIAIVYGFLHFIPGLLQIVAGVRMRKRRGRVFAIVAFASGVLTVLGCYCMPTAIALMIFGLVVMLDPSVRDVMDRESSA